MSKLKSLDELFAARHFDRDVIILCVRWYLRYKLSLRDLVEMMAERGLSIAHTTIMLAPRGRLLSVIRKHPGKAS
jgi:transposase-like protein